MMRRIFQSNITAPISVSGFAQQHDLRQMKAVEAKTAKLLSAVKKWGGQACVAD